MGNILQLCTRDFTAFSSNTETEFMYVISICTVSVIPIYYQPVPGMYGTLNKETIEHGPFFT